VVNKGKSVAGAARLADHIKRTDTNERMEVKEIRGVAAEEMKEAFREMEAVATGCPNCKKPFYHASINTRADERLTDGQRAQAIDRLETELSLTDQPRVVVVHEKEGREHCHIVWSRIDSERMRAISDSHNYRKHELVAREMEREFGHERVQGAHIERDGKARPERAASHKEHQQAARTGIKPQAAREQLTALWRSTDSAESFKAALEERDWMLARGDRRDFVAIDKHGGVHSLSRRIEGATAKDIRARFAGVDRDQLPSVAEGRAAQIERHGPAPNRTKAPARQPREATTHRQRFIRGAIRPAASATRDASRVAGKAVRAGGGLLSGIARGLMGETPARGDDLERRPLDRGAKRHDEEAQRQAEADQSQRRQRYLRKHSREVPDEMQHDADIERDKTRGRERTRGE